MALKRPDTVREGLGSLHYPTSHVVIPEFPEIFDDTLDEYPPQQNSTPAPDEHQNSENYYPRVDRFGNESAYSNRHNESVQHYSSPYNTNRSISTAKDSRNNQVNQNIVFVNHSAKTDSRREIALRIPESPSTNNSMDSHFTIPHKTEHSYEKLISKVGNESYHKPDSGSGMHIKQGGYDNPALVLDPEPEKADTNSTPDPPRKLSSASSSSSESTNSYRDTVYMNDGIRKIDMMIVYEDDFDFTKEQRRQTFFRNLMAEGMEIEFENAGPTRKKTQDIRTRYVKVHAPWEVLTKYAEIMNMKMPIKKLISISYKALDKPSSDDPEANFFWKALGGLKLFDYNHEKIPAEPSFFLASFSRQKEECFIIKDREAFFTPAQRSQIAWKVLTRTRFDDAIQAKASVHKTGIRRLLNDKTIGAAFPLHDGPYNEDNFSGEPNDRYLLYSEWAHFSNFYKKQPLWLIRRYFGDKVGLYFAWLGFYTSMLIPASIVGILCFLFGVMTVGTDYNTPSREICDHRIGGKTIMCPLCGKCDLWQLQDSCTFSKLTYFFDNPATVFFAIFMAFWATSFLEFWKRKHAVISWEWDLQNYEVEEEARPEFEAAVKTFRMNPVTQTAEPYLSFWNKTVRMMVVGSLVFLLLFIVVFVVVGIIIYRLVMMSLLYTPKEGALVDNTTDTDTRIEFFQDNAKIITSVSAAIINLIIVVFLHDRVYYKIAIWLTNSEYPRTQTEYEDSFTFKMFLFQFINYYSSLIYIAFFKGRFFRHPGDDSKNHFEKIRGDMCDPAGCLSELFIQLSIVMIGKQFFNNFMELLLPKLSNWCRRIKYSSASDPDAPGFLTRWEQDYNLMKVDQLALFEEYLEMVIQYGFVTLFVAAFPLAPFFALLNNVVEIRLDAYKWITQLRRPLAERVEDIGAWYGILQGITYTAVVTNAFVIAYTSDIVPRLLYKYSNDNSTLEGYISASLSIYPTIRYGYPNQKSFKNNPVDICYYRGYYETPLGNDTSPFQPTYRYYQIQAARLAFVAVFEHLAFALTGVMAFAIPDMPREISVQIQREKLLATEALYESDLARLKRKSEAHKLDLNEVVSTKGGRRGSITAQDAFLTQLQLTMESEHYNKDVPLTPPKGNLNFSSLHID